MLPIKDLLYGVWLKNAKWASLRKDFQNLKIDDFIHSWQATLVCGPTKEKK